MELYSSADVARLLGIDESKIAYAHRSGKVDHPSYFVAGKRIYTQDDVVRVADHFGIDVKELDQKDNLCIRNTHT